MKIESFGKTLVVSGLSALNVSNAGSFRDSVRASVQPHHTRIEIDMSLTRAIDSTGLGALVSVHRFIASRQGQLRAPAKGQCQCWYSYYHTSKGLPRGCEFRVWWLTRTVRG
jgi:ABC-type transporter Mla MlaB component